MIPKVIHYCWFGRNPKPNSFYEYRKTWEKKCRGYTIIEWNEDNFDISTCPRYVKEAYENKKWAFVSDYVRLKVIFDFGGIYLDTDVEIVKSLNPLRKCNAYFGFEDSNYIATGLGFGAVKHSPIVKEMLDSYNDIPFVKEDGTLDLTACPIRNTSSILKYGLEQNGFCQTLTDRVSIYSSEYLNPKDVNTGIINLTSNTFSIHHYDGTWINSDELNHKLKTWEYFQTIKEKELLHNKNEKHRHRIQNIQKLIGKKGYNLLKKIIKSL